MNDPVPSSSLAQMLCFDVYAVNLAFGRVYKPLLDPLGLTYPQYLVLVSLWDRDDQSVGQIGAALGLDSSTLTPLLKRLEASGLVRRARDPADERRVRISLTDQGRALQGRAASVPAGMARAIDLTRAELRALQAGLSRLRRALLDAAESGDPCT